MFRQAQHDNMENFEFYRLKHQADNLAKLRQEFLSVTRLIAKIFGAVSKIKINAIKERHAFLRAVRKIALIFI